MEESKKITYIKGLYFKNCKEERKIEMLIAEDTPVPDLGVSLTKYMYWVTVVRRKNDITRFEITDFQIEGERKVIFSAPLSDMKFTNKHPLSAYNKIFVVYGRRSEGGYPLKFYCNIEFYRFLGECENGFTKAFNAMF
jgi:hypothetical protein